MGKRFKGIQTGNKYGYGFNVRFSEDNTYGYALFFESSTDLISFIDFKKNYEKKPLTRCILISMPGLKLNILRHTLKTFKGGLKVVLCADNDNAGQTFKNGVRNEGIAFIDCAPSESFKDWN